MYHFMILMQRLGSLISKKASAFRSSLLQKREMFIRTPAIFLYKIQQCCFWKRKLLLPVGVTGGTGEQEHSAMHGVYEVHAYERVGARTGSQCAMHVTSTRSIDCCVLRVRA
jgi:hypothetical protein